MNNCIGIGVVFTGFILLSCVFTRCTDQSVDQPAEGPHALLHVIYASPGGRAQGLGTRNDPVDLHAGLSRVSADTVLELFGGIYRIANGGILYMGGRGNGKNTIRAASGERPIITRENGFPPYVYLKNMTRVEGIWFGGTADSTNTPFNVSNDDEVVSCVFWGYYQGIDDASKHNLYANNLFVNCGRGVYYHPIYITGRSPSWDSCTTVRRNVFVGGEGWAIHLWHGPTYVRVENNFVGNANHCFASDGVPVIARDNIFWSNTQQPTLMIAGDMTLTHNLIGKNHTYYQYKDPAAVSVAADRNSFIEPASPGGPFGTNFVQWQETDATLLLGPGAGNINGATATLQGAFTRAVATVHVDADVEQNWRVLLGVLDFWKTR